MREIRRLLDLFPSLGITYVYVELNMDTDNLSKLALLLAPSHMETEEVIYRIYNWKSKIILIWGKQIFIIFYFLFV